MPPASLQLQSVGIQDLYLTHKPEINFFKYVYKRYVNFATHVEKINLTESANFGKKTSCIIPKKGHLLSKLFLHLQLPQLNRTSGSYLSWTNALGYAIFSDPIELEVGGVVIDRIYPQFLDLWDEFTNSSKKLGRNLMVLKSDLYNAANFNATEPVDLMIPLDFWFTKQYQSALPLLSMYNQEIKINFKFRDFASVVNYDGNSPSSANILDSTVIAEYVILDDVILESFQKQPHMFVIEQVQYNEYESIPQNTSIYNSSLKFNHPVKELFFCCAERTNVDNNNYYVYSATDSQPIINEASLSLEGIKRFEFLPEMYFRTAFPDSVHSCVPLRHIYCIPFSIRPEENQPSGSLNMSRFNDITLSLKLKPNNNEVYLYVYAINYNILKIENGTLSLEFAV